MDVDTFFSRPVWIVLFPAVKSSDEFAKGKPLPVKKNEKGHYNQCYIV